MDDNNDSYRKLAEIQSKSRKGWRQTDRTVKRVADKLDEKDKTEPDNGIRYTKD